MPMTTYTGETEIITKLGTTPAERGLETDEFKAKFDEGLKAFVTWFNDTHKTEFDAHLAEKATDTDLGHVKSDGVTTVVDANGKISMQTGIVSVSEKKILALTDAFKVLNCTNASAITITIPTNTTVAYPVGTEIAIIRSGAGKVTFAGADGVTLNSSGSKKSIKTQHESVALKKTATDTWLLIGSLSA